jgi:hypothetical protein
MGPRIAAQQHNTGANNSERPSPSLSIMVVLLTCYLSSATLASGERALRAEGEVGNTSRSRNCVKHLTRLLNPFGTYQLARSPASFLLKEISVVHLSVGAHGAARQVTLFPSRCVLLPKVRVVCAAGLPRCRVRSFRTIRAVVNKVSRQTSP